MKVDRHKPTTNLTIMHLIVVCQVRGNLQPIDALPVCSADLGAHNRDERAHLQGIVNSVTFGDMKES